MRGRDQILCWTIQTWNHMKKWSSDVCVLIQTLCWKAQSSHSSMRQSDSVSERPWEVNTPQQVLIQKNDITNSCLFFHSSVSSNNVKSCAAWHSSLLVHQQEWFYFEAALKIKMYFCRERAHYSKCNMFVERSLVSTRETEPKSWAHQSLISWLWFYSYYNVTIRESPVLQNQQLCQHTYSMWVVY